MGKNSDGDEINEYERKYKENIKEKYGFDFEEYSKKYLNKETILKNKRIKKDYNKSNFYIAYYRCANLFYSLESTK